MISPPSRDPFLKSFSSIRDYQKQVGPSCVDALERILADTASWRTLNAYITETPDKALAQGEDSRKAFDQNACRSLEGLPLSIKDNFCTKGIRTTAGSRMLSEFVPPYESFVSERVQQAGAICLGKTNMDEFGMGSSTESSFFGPCLNPVALALGMPNHTPGGSSGGAAAAVAADLCLGALATDTGGSIRQPAAYCGVVGMKPTYGLCSRRGIIAYASSLDQAGVIARTVEDAAIIFDAMIGVDLGDSTSISAPLPIVEEQLKKSARQYTVGIPRELRDDRDAGEDVQECWRVAEMVVKDLGFIVKAVDLPTVQYALPAYYIIAFSEASSNLARYDGVRYGFRSPKSSNIEQLYKQSRAQGFGEEVKRRILMGTYSLSAGYQEKYYEHAAKVRRVVSQEFAKAFKEVDCMIWPTTPSSAFEFGKYQKSPADMYWEDIFTVPVNLVGAPAISIPICRAENRLPMGIQIIGRQFGDADVFSVANAMEKCLGQFGRPLTQQ